ncbi:MAG: 23S rRNA (uracil1939-C5)-methyltransferase [Gammaproteobacteria bacterium]|jgi:23S rRNA (uracil1939-C5)-methyltransferase
MARRRRKLLPPPFVVEIESLSHEGRGIAHHNGKIVFVFAALPGEKVLIQLQKSNKKYDEANVVEVLEASTDRIEPKCASFGTCGGCSLQHVTNEFQITSKQQSIEEMVSQSGVQVGEWASPLHAGSWGYRRKARLSVKFVHKKERTLVGFRERNNPFLADMSSCEVLIPEVGKKLNSIAAFIDTLEAREQIPQIEVAADDDNVVLLFRHLKPLSESDSQRLIDFAKKDGFWIQLQPAGPDSIHCLYPENQQLYYKPLADDPVNIEFAPVDFTQVNQPLNQLMVRQVLDWLDLSQDHRVLDLFCGLGNFTLPIARNVASVTAVEGDQVMVDRARSGARRQNFDNTDYFVEDLTQPDPGNGWMRQTYDRILLDPPRPGAFDMVKIIKRFKAEKIVYVSCHPASLVRDAAELQAQGYKVTKMAVMDMFPQTAHIESMALFERKLKK